MSLVEAELIQNYKARRKRLWSSRGVQDDGIDLKRGKAGGRFGEAPIVARRRLPSESRTTKQSAAPVTNITPANLPAPRYPTVNIIIDVVSEWSGLSRTDLLSQRRTKDLIRPRHTAMFLAKRLTLHSLPRIGLRIGGRDHTSVLHAVRKMECLFLQDDTYAAEVNELAAKILRRAHVTVE